MTSHIMSTMRMRMGSIPDVRNEMRVKLPFQNACPRIAMASITGSDVGSWRFDDFVNKDDWL